MGEVSQEAERTARQVHHSEWLDHAVRVGLVAYGVVHLLIAWLVAQLAFGDKANASNRGALHTLAEQPLGAVLVWLVAGGMVLLVVWRLLEAVFGHEGEEGFSLWRKRAMSVFKAVVYGTIGWTAASVALGNGSSGGKDSLSARLMALPGGQLILGLVGLGIIAYGLNTVRRGWSEKFTEHLEAEGQTGQAGRAYVMFGKVGYVARGVAIVLVGGLFVYAAFTHRAKEAGGLDQALETVREQPFGPVLLAAVALGFACYGLFCFARARHLSR